MEGILLFALAGFVSASFYTPLKFVKWSWELMWIFWTLFACIVAPMVIASVAIPSCWEAIGKVETDILFKTFGFGALWGIGGLTFGLSMRYLGIGLGTAVALGFCSIGGTLIPQIFNGKIVDIASNKDGILVLVGLLVCAIGIAINGVAGIMKEKDSAGGDKSEFNLAKGFTVAIIAGLLSACMNFSIEVGTPIAEKAKEIAVFSQISAEQAELFKNSAILIVTLLGGFITNFVWCFYLSIKNKSTADFKKQSLGGNVFFLILCAIGGVLWYCQFFLFGMGKTKLNPEYAFASWAILMALIIVFAGLISFFIGEWRGTSKSTKIVLWIGILVLSSSTFIMAK